MKLKITIPQVESDKFARRIYNAISTSDGSSESKTAIRNLVLEDLNHAMNSAFSIGMNFGRKNSEIDLS